MTTPRTNKIKHLESAYRKLNKKGFPVEMPITEGIKDGDKFTIAGLRYMKNGRIIRNCKSGMETVMTANIVPPIGTIMPAIAENE